MERTQCLRPLNRARGRQAAEKLNEVVMRASRSTRRIAMAETD